MTEETEYYRTFDENVEGMEQFSSRHTGKQIGYETSLKRKADASGKIVSTGIETTQTIPPAYSGSDTKENSMEGMSNSRSHG